MARRKIKIESSKEYHHVMKQIDSLMRLGENMDDKSASELRSLALAAQAYEKGQFEIPPPESRK